MAGGLLSPPFSAPPRCRPAGGSGVFFEGQPLLWGLQARGPAGESLRGCPGQHLCSLVPSPRPHCRSRSLHWATFSSEPGGQGLAGRQQPQGREGSQFQGPTFPRIGAPSCPLSIPP